MLMLTLRTGSLTIIGLILFNFVVHLAALPSAPVFALPAHPIDRIEQSPVSSPAQPAVHRFAYAGSHVDWPVQRHEIRYERRYRPVDRRRHNREPVYDRDGEDGVAFENSWRRNGLVEVKFKCKQPVRGLGTQWIGTKGAMEAAKKDWMERVRYDHGESYLDMGNAKEFVSRCGRVSVGEVMDQVMYRCEIVARPCQAGMQEGEGTTK